MFSNIKISTDLTGTADNCTCILRDQMAAELSSKYVLLGETIQIFLKSLKEDHLFTDLAYISVKGNTAGGSKRLIVRFDYQSFPISNVYFETCGVGITDQDCELKFTIGGQSLSIDIRKQDMETGILYYRTLCAVANAQKRTAQQMAALNCGRKNLDIHIQNGEDLGKVLASAYNSALSEAVNTVDLLNPVSYRSIFEQYLLNR